MSECRKLIWSRSCSTSDKVVDDTVGAVHRRFSRPCDHAATVVQWKCLRVSYRRRQRTFQLCNREGYGDERVYGCWRGFFGGFDAFFRAPPVVPEVSASFRAREHSHLFVDTQTLVEQAVDVLKISQDSIQQRMVDRDLRHPQMAEQFVEVPTVLLEKVSASSAHKPYKEQQQPSPEG